MPATNERTGADATTALSTITMSGLKGQQSKPMKSPWSLYHTDAALVGESFEAIVGQVTIRMPQSTAAAFATSRILPPPMPTEMSAPPIASDLADPGALGRRGFALEHHLDQFQARFGDARLDGPAHDVLHAAVPQDHRPAAQELQVAAQLAEHSAALHVLVGRNEHALHRWSSCEWEEGECPPLPASWFTKAVLGSRAGRGPRPATAPGDPGAARNTKRTTWGCCGKRPPCCRPGGA